MLAALALVSGAQQSDLRYDVAQEVFSPHDHPVQSWHKRVLIHQGRDARPVYSLCGPHKLTRSQYRVPANYSGLAYLRQILVLLRLSSLIKTSAPDLVS